MKFLGRTPKRIYADAAAATPVHPRVRRRMTRLLGAFANPGALHREALAAKSELERARQEAAVCIGAHSDEIIFTAGGTEANNLAVLGSLRSLLRKNKHIHAITSAIEHSSVLAPLAHLKDYGLSLTVLPVDGEGLVSPRQLGEALTSHTALVSVQLVNGEIGTIEPLREVAKAIRRERQARAESGNALRLLFHTDAAQAPLYLPARIDTLGVDLMTLDAQKILGPKSVGALYRRRGTALESALFGGRQEQGLRPGTESVFLAGAFAEALSMATEGVDERAARVRLVRDHLLDKLHATFPDALINGSIEHRIANNVNVSIPGLDGEAAVIALDAHGIAVSTRAACETEEEKPSYVVAALGSGRRAQEAVRITLLPSATVKEADAIVDALVKARALYGKKE